ncbi:MAG: prepilin-type N-terminal cleavage/methylation domain-containing protein [Nitrospinae bacterium]|nr:prepilin-type N-terminal cleavage/methylation domain-containing protein [Nitrospinota bacterium]
MKLRNFKIFNIQYSIINFQCGFTLLEVMVAIAILGLGLTVVFELFSGGLKSVEISNDYSNAVILANKKMGELSLKEMLKVGKEAGDFPEEDNYKWEVEIEPYKESSEFGVRNSELEKKEEDKTQSNTESPVKIYRLDVRVFWKTGLTEKDVRLTSLRTFMEKPTEEAATK